MTEEQADDIAGRLAAYAVLERFISNRNDRSFAFDPDSAFSKLFAKGESARLAQEQIMDAIADGQVSDTGSLTAKTEWVVRDPIVVASMQGNVPESIVGSFEYSWEIEGDQVSVEARNSTTIESLWRNPLDREAQLEPMYSYWSFGNDLTGMYAPVSQTIQWSFPLTAAGDKR